MARPGSVAPVVRGGFWRLRQVPLMPASGCIRVVWRPRETAVVTMRLDGGTLAVLDATLLDPGGYDTRAELIGANDSAAVGLGPRTPMRRLDPPATPEERWDHYRVRFREAYAAELVAFLGVARGERPSPVTARDGLEALRIAVAATRSYIERRAVRLDEIPGLATEEGRR